MSLPLLFSFILVVVHYLSEKINIQNEKWHVRAISFVAGLSVTYAFLSLLPEAYEKFENHGKFIFIFIIAGFSTVHVVEKYIYQHIRQGHNLRHKLKEVHSISFFLYYLLLGAILVDLSNIGNIQVTLFFIPVLFYAAVGLFSLDKIHHKIRKHSIARSILSIAPIMGVLLAETLLKTGIYFDILFALVIGTFIYVALIDFIPRDRKGEPVYFIFGVTTYTLLILLLLL